MNTDFLCLSPQRPQHQMYNRGSINTHWPGLKRQGWDWPNRDKDGWYRDQNNNLILPATLGHHLCEHLHTTTHLGERKTLTLLQTACLRFSRQNAAVQEIIQACKACRLMRAEKKQHTGTRYRGQEPGQHWAIDFTEVRPGSTGIAICWFW